jgi:hypothetical protein
MKKFMINGVEFNNFGPNNYSDGMELITVNNPKEDFVQRVLAGEFHGIYLNPSAPCYEEEFFGVFGTSEQYKKFYAKQKESIISKGMIDKFGWGLWPAPKVTDAYEEELRKNYKDWWEK